MEWKQHTYFRPLPAMEKRSWKRTTSAALNLGWDNQTWSLPLGYRKKELRVRLPSGSLIPDDTCQHWKNQ
jgi:hypothetical protein